MEYTRIELLSCTPLFTLAIVYWTRVKVLDYDKHANNDIWAVFTTLYFSQHTNGPNKAQVFVSDRPFQLSLMFFGKARSLPERCFTQVGSYLARKH
jgi:hypothetical protein